MEVVELLASLLMDRLVFLLLSFSHHFWILLLVAELSQESFPFVQGGGSCRIVMALKKLAGMDYVLY